MAIAHRLPLVLQPWGRMGREFKRLLTEVTVKVNLGIVAAEAVDDLLRRIGEFALGHGTGLLVTIDEAQGAAAGDLAATAMTIQTVVNREQLPIAFIFSGLPIFRQHIATAGTFATRLTIHDIADLDPGATRLAFVEPAARHHVGWNPDALDFVVDRSGGHPYYIQLFGSHVWRAAGGATTLTIGHVEAGVISARRELHGQFLAAWTRLRPQERTYLAAVAELVGPGPVSVADVAGALGRRPQNLSVVRDRLIHQHGLLEVPDRGSVKFSSGEMAGWVGLKRWAT